MEAAAEKKVDDAEANGDTVKNKRGLFESLGDYSSFGHGGYGGGYGGGFGGHATLGHGSFGGHADFGHEAYAHGGHDYGHHDFGGSEHHQHHEHVKHITVEKKIPVPYTVTKHIPYTVEKKVCFFQIALPFIVKLNALFFII